MNRLFLSPKDSEKYVLFRFYSDGKPLEEAGAPLCGMTLRAARSMRFRWNENNPGRELVLGRLFGGQRAVRGSALPAERAIVPLQLDHTHVVYDISSAGDTQGKVGDGIITTNRSLAPSVTVADCVPIFLFDPVSGVFGIVHSGWRGTGIAAEAVALAQRNYGARAEDFCVVVGPHIHDCCYIVDENRASYFAERFTPECVRPLEEGEAVNVSWNSGSGKLFHLSLEGANVALLKKIGIQDKNITLYADCTCCNPVFGSNRRESSAAGKPGSFTVMAAFIFFTAECFRVS